MGHILSNTYSWLEVQYVSDEIAKNALTQDNTTYHLLFDKTEWTIYTHPSEHVPQQNNDCDCGVYNMFAEFVTNSFPFYF